MTVDLNELLTIVLYLALIVLVIILIVLGIKFIKTLKKVDIVLDNLNGKLDSLEGVFNIIDKTSSYATSIGDKIMGSISNFLNVLIGRKKGNDEDE